jgi:radical SAM superfamily enzyme YgiQ (UPF0313 family)
MHVLLIMPDGNIHKIGAGSFKRSMREAPLTLTTLAALVPGSSGCTVEIVDESIGQNPLNRRADLVGISVITGTAPRAYDLAAHYRSRGVPVVLGGVHVTLLPEEAARHADAIVIGPAERTWPQLLEDAAGGRLAERYQGAEQSAPMLTGIPIPRRALQKNRRYNIPDAVMATRGCPNTCDFCTVPNVFPYYAKRPVADVIDDVRTVRSRFFVFNDVSLTDDTDYAKELFGALIPLKKRWAGLATVRVAQDQELLGLMRRSGCQGLLIGFESVSQASLLEIHKGFNRTTRYGEVVKTLHEHEMCVQGTFIFGFDHDDASVFDETLACIDDIGVDIPRFSILTPYPGTRLFARLSSEGRLLSYAWSDYDTMHVVFEPARMSAEALYQGFKRVYRQAFMLGRIRSRLRSAGFRGLVSLIGNLTYRRFANRLDREDRYARPYTPGHRRMPPAVGQALHLDEKSQCPM